MLVSIIVIHNQLGHRKAIRSKGAQMVNRINLYGENLILMKKI